MRDKGCYGLILVVLVTICMQACKTQQTGASQITAQSTGDTTGRCTIGTDTYSKETCLDYNKVTECIRSNCVEKLNEACQKNEGREFRGGDGFIGNMLGYAKCDHVHNSARGLIDKCLNDHVFTSDVRPCTIVNSGLFVNQHIYYGICMNGEVLSWTDPWKYGHCKLYKPNTGYHSSKHKVEEWVQRTSN